MLAPLSPHCRLPVLIPVSNEWGSGAGYRCVMNLSLLGWYVS